MILDPTLKLEAVLAGAVSANQPEVHVDFVDYNNEGVPTLPSDFRVALNSASDVTILAAPTLPRREVLRISIYNKDTASITVTVKTDDSTTERIIIKKTIGTLDSLCWEKGLGWYTTATQAGIFTTLTVTGALTYGGVTLNAAVTGTGNMVLSANPTFTGTITAAAANFSGIVDAAQTMRATGGTAPSTGAGIEIGYSSNTGVVIAFDRTGATRKTLNLDGSTVNLTPGGSTTLSASTTGVAVTGTLSSTSSVSAYSGTSIPAGGTAGSGVLLSSTANFGLFFGSGAPSLSAAKGSIYLRSDGSGTTDRAYINTNGATTWTALTTVA